MRIETADDKEYAYYDEALRKTAVSEYVNNRKYRKRLYKSYVQTCHDEMGDDIENSIQKVIDTFDLKQGELSEPMHQLSEIIIHHVSKNDIFGKDYVNKHPECIRELLEMKVGKKKRREKEREDERKNMMEYQKKQYAILNKKKDDYNVEDIELLKTFKPLNETENEKDKNIHVSESHTDTDTD